MECRAVITSLSDFIDGRNMWPADNEYREIESHLTECPNCQRVRLELTEIRTAARDLPLHTPPRALWTRVSNMVEAELPSSERPTLIDAPEASWWRRLKSRKLTLTLPQLAGASALAVTLILYSVFSPPASSPGTLNFAGVQNALLPNEDQIKADIDRRLSVINARKGNWDPRMRDEFDRHLSKIEESLNNSRLKLQANPNDKVHQEMVLSLYQEKRQLLEDIERLKW